MVSRPLIENFLRVRLILQHIVRLRNQKKTSFIVDGNQNRSSLIMNLCWHYPHPKPTDSTYIVSVLRRDITSTPALFVLFTRFAEAIRRIMLRAGRKRDITIFDTKGK